ncbi:uncharacterized protein LOC143038028 isoform X2 [Oratosquilla oratoria]
MKFFVFISFALVFLMAAHAVPVQQEQDITEAEDSGSRTWSAITSFFRPIQIWFVEKLPEKTPSDLMNDAKDTAAGFGDWASENNAIQSMVNSLRPLRVWVSETATTLKEKSFNDMYSDVKEGISELDQKVGTYIDEKIVN